MDDLPGIADGMAEAAVLLMLRAGLVSADQIVAVAAEYDTRADREPAQVEADRLRGTAHQLRVIAIDHEPPGDVDPAVEAAAVERRRQIRLRTAWLEHEGKTK